MFGVSRSILCARLAQSLRLGFLIGFLTLPLISSKGVWNESLGKNSVLDTVHHGVLNIQNQEGEGSHGTGTLIESSDPELRGMLVLTADHVLGGRSPSVSINKDFINTINFVHGLKIRKPPRLLLRGLYAIPYGEKTFGIFAPVEDDVALVLLEDQLEAELYPLSSEPISSGAVFVVGWSENELGQDNAARRFGTMSYVPSYFSGSDLLLRPAPDLCLPGDSGCPALQYGASGLSVVAVLSDVWWALPIWTPALPTIIIPPFPILQRINHFASLSPHLDWLQGQMIKTPTKDNACFLDPTVWSANGIPGAGDIIRIPRGSSQSMCFDTSPTADGIVAAYKKSFGGLFNIGTLNCYLVEDDEVHGCHDCESGVHAEPVFTGPYDVDKPPQILRFDPQGIYNGSSGILNFQHITVNSPAVYNRGHVSIAGPVKEHLFGYSLKTLLDVTGIFVNTGGGEVDNDGIIIAAELLNLNASVKGNGIWIVGGRIFLDGCSVQPGNSIGHLRWQGAVELAGENDLEVEVSDLTGSPGQTPGWDLMSIEGSASFVSSSSNLLKIIVKTVGTNNVEGLDNFDPQHSYAIPIFATTKGIVGLTRSNLRLDPETIPAVFSNGVLTLRHLTNSLFLSYAPTNDSFDQVYVEAQPSNLCTNVHQNVTLTVRAKSASSLSYQWFRDEQPILGATNASLVFSNTGANDSGAYFAEARNQTCLVRSAVASVQILTTNMPPTIRAIRDQVILEDETIRLPLFVQDCDTPTGELVINATSQDQNLFTAEGLAVVDDETGNKMLVISPNKDQFGTTEVTVFVSDGHLTTQTKFVVQVLSVPDVPVFLQRAPIQMMKGTSFQFQLPFVSADHETFGYLGVKSSNESLFFVKNPDQPLSKDFASVILNTNELGLVVTLIPDSVVVGSARISITFAEKSVISFDVNVAETATAPQLVTPLQPQSLTVGLPLWLQAGVGGPVDLTYQWQKDGVNIPGATNWFFHVPTVTLPDAGNYSVIVGNNQGHVTGGPAKINVGRSPTVAVQPAQVELFPGETKSIALLSSGDGTVKRQWWTFSDSGRAFQIPGETNITLVVTNADSAPSHRVFATVESEFGNAVSAVSEIRLKTSPPWFSQQTVGTDWVKQGGGTSSVKSIRAVGVDCCGNAYAVGFFDGTATEFGSSTLVTDGQDGFVLSYKSDGSINWTLQIGGKESQIARHLAVDSSGNLTVAGDYFGGGISVYGVRYTNTTATGSFLLGIDPRGNLISGKLLPGISVSALKSKGNYVYAAASFSGSISFDGVQFATSAQRGTLLAKWSLEGALEWATVLGGNESQDYVFTSAVDADESGNIFVCGAFKEHMRIGELPALLDPHTSFYSQFIGKLDSKGTPTWLRPLADGDDDTFYALAVDREGSALVGAGFLGTWRVNETTNVSHGDADAYLAKIANDGRLVWVRQTGGLMRDRARGVTTDQVGNVYQTGFCGRETLFDNETIRLPGLSHLFLVSYDTDGNQRFLYGAGGYPGLPGTGGRAAALDSMGHLFLGGQFGGTVYFGSNVLTAVGTEDAFLARLSLPTEVKSVGPSFLLSGSTLTLDSAAQGAGNLTFQWMFDGLEITAATNSLLVLSNATESGSGVYEVRVSDGTRAVTSQPTLLSIQKALRLNLVAGDEGPQFVAEGPRGASVVLEESTNVTSWRPVWTNSISSKRYGFGVKATDPKFYRLSLWP